MTVFKATENFQESTK